MTPSKCQALSQPKQAKQELSTLPRSSNCQHPELWGKEPRGPHKPAPQLHTAGLEPQHQLSMFSLEHNMLQSTSPNMKVVQLAKRQACVD